MTASCPWASWSRRPGSSTRAPIRKWPATGCSVRCSGPHPTFGEPLTRPRPHPQPLPSSMPLSLSPSPTEPAEPAAPTAPTVPPSPASPASLAPPASPAGTAGTAGTAGHPGSSRPSGVAAALLMPLTELVPVMSAPCPMHPSVGLIGAELAVWARRWGSNLLRAPGSADGGPRLLRVRRGVGAAVRQMADLAVPLRRRVGREPRRARGRDRRGHLRAAQPRRTRPRPRLLARRAGLRRPLEGHHRADEHPVAAPVPGGAGGAGRGLPYRGREPVRGPRALPAEYPRLRRGTAGPYLFDLVEPCLGVEVPAGCARARPGGRWWTPATTSPPGATTSPRTTRSGPTATCTTT